MTSHGQLEPTAERRAMNGEHDRLGGVFDAHEQVMEIGRLDVGIPRRPFQVPDVGAGDEGAPGASDHDGTNGWMGTCLIKGANQPLGHAWTQRVDRRVVDFDNCNIVAQRDRNKIGHRNGSSAHRWAGEPTIFYVEMFWLGPQRPVRWRATPTG
jgi:hypothetical protein